MTPLQYLGVYLFTVLILWAAIKMSPEAKAEEEALARYPALQKAVDIGLYIYLFPLFLAHVVRQKIHPRRLLARKGSRSQGGGAVELEVRPIRPAK